MRLEFLTSWESHYGCQVSEFLSKRSVSSTLIKEKRIFTTKQDSWAMLVYFLEWLSGSPDGVANRLDIFIIQVCGDALLIWVASDLRDFLLEGLVGKSNMELMKNQLVIVDAVLSLQPICRLKLMQFVCAIPKDGIVSRYEELVVTTRWGK